MVKISLNKQIRPWPKATEQGSAETFLKIIGSGQDKLVNTAKVIHAITQDTSEDQLTERSEEIVYNIGYVWNIAQKLIGSRGLGLTRRACVVMEETSEVANQSSYKVRKLQRRLNFIPTRSEAYSITGANPSGKIKPRRTQNSAPSSTETTGAVRGEPTTYGTAAAARDSREQAREQRFPFFRSRMGEFSGEVKKYLGPDWGRTRGGHGELAGVLHGRRSGQMRANNVG